MAMLKRWFLHLFTDHWSVRRAFPPAALRAIEKAIGEEERRHSGQLRFAVEASLPFRELLRDWLGLGVSDPEARVRLELRTGLAAGAGVRVESVEPGGAAQRAGIEPGDVIIGYDGENVAGVDQLHRLLSEERIGKTANVTLLRRTQKLELSIRAAEMPPRP